MKIVLTILIICITQAARQAGWLAWGDLLDEAIELNGTIQLNPTHQLINVQSPGLEQLSFAAILPEFGLIAAGDRCSRLYTLAISVSAIVAVLSLRWLVRQSVRLFRAAQALVKHWGHQPESKLTTALNRTTEQLQASRMALQQQEAKLAQVQRVAHVGSWELDLSASKLTWSDELLNICGLEPGVRSPIQALRLIHPDDLAKVKQVLKAAFKDGRAFQLEHRLIRADGQVRSVNSSGQAIAQVGKPKKLFGTVMDITERKQTERERDNLLKSEQSARQSAEAANRNKDKFFALLSHELKTPLNPILGWSQILQKRPFSEATTQQALETIERNAKMQLQLIDDLLDFSQLLRGQIPLSYSSVNLIAVITTAIKQVQVAADAKSITIKPIFDPTIGAIRGDLKRLQQVVWNLLSNAVKFSPEGSEVEVKLQRVNNHAQIIVKDNGKGIKPEFLPQIFNGFSQEDSSSTREFGGLGLGLAIVHYLVELHGGTITATSPGVNRGATFTVNLPLTNQT